LRLDAPAQAGEGNSARASALRLSVAQIVRRSVGIQTMAVGGTVTGVNPKSESVTVREDL